jgi:hypothetical protein
VRKVRWPFKKRCPDRPCVNVSEQAYERVLDFAYREGLTLQAALERCVAKVGAS